MKRFLIFALAALAIAGCGQPQTIAVLSVNDMHGQFKTMPELKYVADSLRKEYPKLLILSAGDNRTGNPLNDAHEEPSWPMTDLMNQVGFDISTLGNHEFDGALESFVLQAGKSKFPYVSCNVKIEDKVYDGMIQDYKVFDFDGQGPRIAIVGMTQVDTNSHIPDCSPEKVNGFIFEDHTTVVQRYAHLKKKNDMVIILAHNGYEGDVALSEKVSGWCDWIIGGHSHTLIEGGEEHNGVWITQCERKLKYVTLTKLQFKGRKLQGINSEIIELKGLPRDEAIAEVVAGYSNNETFTRVLGYLDRSITRREGLGLLMLDALKEGTGADIAVANRGSVRLDEFPAGPITVEDVLSLDPFGNETVIYDLTGAQVLELLKRCHLGDLEYGPGYILGGDYTITIDKKDIKNVLDVKMTMPDGSPIDLEKKYRVVFSSYMAVITGIDELAEGVNTFTTTSDFLVAYLEKHQHVDFEGQKHMTTIWK
ncbi:MAG: bifunctional metallophosphatase/5'-nucleotidase [Bacteroidales bacterium]|nr:bifunctional metallophosphatase/5'-nucleotidase [Bacteroidales bacterium]